MAAGKNASIVIADFPRVVKPFVCHAVFNISGVADFSVSRSFLPNFAAVIVAESTEFFVASCHKFSPYLQHISLLTFLF